MARLAGKVAVITGGNSGIGLASAIEFAREGAQVIITGRRRSALDDALDQIGHNAIAVEGDVADLGHAEALAVDVERKFGRIDVYVANAGICILEPFGDITEANFDRQFDINTKGVFFGVQSALRLMPDGASIVLVGSIGSQKVLPGHVVYAASKAALRAFARYWTHDLRQRRIRVNVLSPGPVKTPMLEKLGIPTKYLQSPDDPVAALIPLGRWGEASELAKAALFLASDDSSFVSGIELCADGGMAQI